MKPALLFLSHRIPYPPNKGDKIRSFHLLKYLSEKYRVFLAAFIDDDSDWQYAEKMSEWCEQTKFLTLKPGLGKFKSLKGFMTGEPLTLPYYYHAGMADWISDIVRGQSIDNILVYSSAMAQYVTTEQFSGRNKVIDFVDVDSDKWRQYSEKKSWPMDWIYRREAQELLAFERKIAASFRASLLVSAKEAELFKELAPESAEKISFYSNGVDLDEFDPMVEMSNPYSGSGPHVVFTGAMDYWPNEDAVVWFAREVLPIARKQWPSLTFYIVGSKPTENVKALENITGVEVTGRVADIRPYINSATVIVAPMRIARGIQNKVLEAMAMARPVIVSSMGIEGIDAKDGDEVLIADRIDEYIEALPKVIDNQLPKMGMHARERVINDFSWHNTLPKIDRWLTG